MNLKEFGAWSPYNKDNPKYNPDEYNRSFIKERFECPQGYENSDFGEYYSVPKMEDAFHFEKKGEKREQKPKGNKSRNLRQNMLSRVVCLAAGSVVITTSYQSVIRQQQQPPAAVQTQEQNPGAEKEAEPIALSPVWNWSEDKQTVILQLCDAQGNVIEEITAVVSVSDVEATCNTEGERTYTATADYEDKTYSDSQSETLLPLGHQFGEGKETVLENGQTAVEFECARCHEQFTIGTAMTEND